MGIFYNTSIARDGLVLHLDAANKKSYPGTGTTWKDLSGNGNHFTLFNSPVFTDKYLNFSGINEYARSNNTLDLSPFDSVTVELTLKVNTEVSPSGMAFEHSGNWNTNTMGFGLVPNSNSATTYVPNSHHTNQFSGAGAFNYTGIISTNITTHTNIWSKIAKTDGRKSYINAVIQGEKSTGNYGNFRDDFFYI
jgi:hypothetical protein